MSDKKETPAPDAIAAKAAATKVPQRKALSMMMIGASVPGSDKK